MEFKVGDRVHVTRLDGKDVDFYGTLREDYDKSQKHFKLTNCTESELDGLVVYNTNHSGFGKEYWDYYELVEEETDEEVEPVKLKEVKDIIIRTLDNKEFYYDTKDVEAEDLDELETDIFMNLKGIAVDPFIKVKLKRGKYEFINSKYIVAMSINYKED